MPSLINPVSTAPTGSSGSGADLITPSSVSTFNAAVTSGPTSAATPAAGAGPTAELAALIKQLIPLLQQLLGGDQGGSAAGGQAASGGAHSGAAHEGAAHEGGSTESAPAAKEMPKATAPATAGGADQLTTLVPQLISMLQKTEGQTAAPEAKEAPETKTPASAHAESAPAGGAKSELTSLLTQLVALLEKIVGTGGSSDAGKPATASLADAKTEGLVKQLITQLQAQPASATSTAPTTTTTTDGSAKQPSYTPGMGISGAEINAMIAAANGTGPELVLSDWSKGTPTYVVPTTSPTAGGQVANLGAQVGNEAA